MVQFLQKSNSSMNSSSIKIHSTNQTHPYFLQFGLGFVESVGNAPRTRYLGASSMFLCLLKGALESNLKGFYIPQHSSLKRTVLNNLQLSIPHIYNSTFTCVKVRTAPVEPTWDAVPEMCRAALADWDKAVVGLGEELMSILSEGLGVKSDRLKKLSCLDARKMVCHYYPRCPQPELTVGLTPHTDPGVLTVLVQNEVGGLLQVKCGEDWADIEAVPGAIVINIGDLLQIMSNDKYKSVMHRVLANPIEGARVSIAMFLSPSIQKNLYGPFPELISAEKPAAYREFTYEEYITRFFKKELNEKSLPNFYRINNTKA